MRETKETNSDRTTTSRKDASASAKAAHTMHYFWRKCYQSLEFVAETRILAEMKIGNCGKKIFTEKLIDKHTFFFFFF